MKIIIKTKSILSKLFGLFLLATPFLIGFGIYSFLQPTDFWQNVVCLIVTLVVCIVEGVFAWILGLILLGGD